MRDEYWKCPACSWVMPTVGAMTWCPCGWREAEVHRLGDVPTSVPALDTSDVEEAA
jgi:hypothetical protein